MGSVQGGDCGVEMLELGMDEVNGVGSVWELKARTGCFAGVKGVRVVVERLELGG